MDKLPFALVGADKTSRSDRTISRHFTLHDAATAAALHIAARRQAKEREHCYILQVDVAMLAVRIQDRGDGGFDLVVDGPRVLAKRPVGAFDNHVQTPARTYSFQTDGSPLNNSQNEKSSRK